MALVNMKRKAMQFTVEGEPKWCPVIQLGDNVHPISNQCKVIAFDTEKEAEEYFED